MRLVRGTETWEVHHEGTQVRIGSALRRFVSAERAKAAYDSLVAERRAEGFVEAPDLVTDLDARLVHADDLQQRGDPLGELIAIQAALDAAEGPARKPLERRMAKLLAAHHAAIFGPVAAVAAPLAKRPAIEVTWRHGFAERVRLQQVAKLPLDEVYVAFRRLPLAAYVRELVIGEAIDASYAALVATMVHDGMPARLRRLELVDVPAEERVHAFLGDLRPVIAACSELEELRLAGKTGIIGPVGAPRLRQLAIDGLGSAAAALVGSPLPALTELAIHHNDRTMLDRLLDSGIIRRLRKLALVHCGLQDADLKLVLEEAEQFAHLEVLDLRGTRFDPALHARARERVPGLR